MSYRSHLLRGCTALATILLVASCATPEPAPAPVPVPVPAPAPAPAPVVVEPEPPKPAAPVVPELTPAQAKTQAQKLAIEAVDALQNGDEEKARSLLEEAQVLDSRNDLARKLMAQIKANPQKELGSVYFRYTVQKDDSLSKIAQQYLGDLFLFHILAKYNDIANPSRLAAGQVIKIPGHAPTPGSTPSGPAGVPAAATGGEAAAKAMDSAAPRSASPSLMQQAAEMQRAGNLTGAYESYREAAVRDPGNREAAQKRDALRQTLIRRYEREATQAFQRQKLDESIAKWDQVLALDPGNQKAKLERERAIDLRKKMSEKFGAK